MLKKLLKYDLQAMFKYFVPMTIFILLYSFLTTLFFRIEDVGKDTNGLLTILIFFSIAGYVIFVIAYAIITQGIIVVDFFKSMVTDRGYLTHTLPVKKSTIMTAKYLAGFITIAISYLVIIVSLIAFLDVPRLWLQNHHIIIDAFEELFTVVSASSVAFAIISAVIACIISIIYSLSCFYLCIAIGQRVNRHKIVGSIVAYGVLMIIMQIISSICTYAIRFGTVLNTIDETMNLNAFSFIMIGSSVVFAVLSTVMAIVTHEFFTKKLNLD